MSTPDPFSDLPESNTGASNDLPELAANRQSQNLPADHFSDLPEAQPQPQAFADIPDKPTVEIPVSQGNEDGRFHVDNRTDYSDALKLHGPISAANLSPEQIQGILDGTHGAKISGNDTQNPVLAFAQNAYQKVNDVINPKGDRAAQAFVELTAHSAGMSVDQLRQSVGGMSSVPRQFLANAMKTATFGLIAPSVSAPDSPGTGIAAGLGKLGGFLLGPVKASDVMVAPLAKYFDVSANDGRIIALAKDMSRQGITLGVAQGLSATPEAVNQKNIHDALQVYAKNTLSGLETGFVFGAAGKILPKPGVLNFFGRAALINAGMDALNGSNPLDKRPLWQKVYDYGLNTAFVLHGSGTEFPDKTAREVAPDVGQDLPTGYGNLNESSNNTDQTGGSEPASPGAETPPTAKPTLQNALADVENKLQTATGDEATQLQQRRLALREALGMPEELASPQSPAVKPEFQNPHQLRVQTHLQKAEAQGLSPEQAAAFMPEDVRDPVTGFFEARDRIPTIERAQALPEGHTPIYIEADIANLGGLNGAVGHSTANGVYREIGGILHEELDKIGTVVPFRHGGDEISAVVVGARPEAVQKALAAAKARVDAYTQEAGYGDLVHPKHPEDASKRGVHLTVGTARIAKTESIPDILRAADVDVERNKLGETHVNREPAEQTGAAAPERPAGGTENSSGQPPEQATASPSAEAETAAPKPRKVKPLIVRPERDDLLAAIAKLGGIKRDEAQSVYGVDPADMRMAFGHSIYRVFTKKGMGADSMAEALAEEGYPVLDEHGNYDPHVLMDHVDEALRGRKVWSTHAAGNVFERMRQQHEEAQQTQHQGADVNHDEYGIGTGFDYNEPTYEETWSPAERAAHDLATKAKEIDPDATDTVLEQWGKDAITDNEAIKRFEGIIGGEERHNEAQNSREKTQARTAGSEAADHTARETVRRNEAVSDQAPALELTQTEAPKPQARANSPQQQDLLGGASETQQAVHREQLKRDESRNSGQTSAETGNPNDLFSQARHQVDLVDAARTASPDTAAFQRWFSGSNVVDADGKPLTVYHGGEARSFQSMAWFTPERKAAEQYANQHENGRVQGAYLDIKKPAGADELRAAAKAEGINPDEHGLYWLLRPDMVDGAERIAIRLQGEGFDGVHLPKGEDFAPDGDAIESWLAFKSDQIRIKSEKDSVSEPNQAEIPRTGTGNIEDMGEKIGGARKDLSIKTGPKRKQRDERPAWMKRFVAMEDMKRHKWHIVDTRTGWPLRGAGDFDTQEEADKAIPLAAVSLKHRVVEKEPGNWGIRRQVTDRKRVYVKDGFPTEEAAMTYMVTHAGEILDTKTGFGEEILARPEKVMRSGVERRTGNVDGQKFMDTFGFRGVEFGNWNNQDERQEVMNHAYDGLLDLADTLNIPPDALSLNGDLALAFGARGHGLEGARAHYEPSYAVINLTKMKGAGSLAHEWFHALDHYLARLDGKSSRERVEGKKGDKVYKTQADRYQFQSYGESIRTQLRPELVDAYNTLIKTLFTKAEQYVEDTQRAEQFVQQARNYLDQQLKGIRDHIAKERQYGSRKRAATPAELAEFDALAEKLINGQAFKTEYRPDASKKYGRGRTTNDTLEAINDILKAVTNRQGFNTESSGTLDSVRGYLNNYRKRTEQLESARKEDVKTKRVPTIYAMNAKAMDEGRVSDYWSEPYEMAARAFSAYVEDKAEAEGKQSDFLSFGSDNKYYLFARPFPTGKERQEMDAAFDRFFKVLKTKKEKGRTILYSLTPRTISGAPLFSLNGKHGSDRSESATSPNVDIATPLGTLKDHPDYDAAKAGDYEAAIRLVQDVLPDHYVEDLKNKFEGTKPIIVAVHAEEAAGRNQIPQAFAEVLGHRLGFPVDDEIVQSSRALHTGKGAFHRIAFHGTFDGPVEGGAHYLIADDTVTMGGTLANLRGHIEANGGHVDGILALSGHPGSSKIALSPETLQKLRDKYGSDLENYWQREFGFGLNGVTEGEAAHLLKAGSVDEIRNRLSAARQEAGVATDEGNPGGSTRLSKAGASVRKALATDNVNEAISPLLNKWGTNAPRVDVVQSEDDLPADYRDDINSIGAHGQVEGFYDPATRRVYLVADNLSKPEDAVRTLLHEVRGHFRLREFFGRDIDPVLNQVLLTYGRKGLNDILDRYGLDWNNRDDRMIAAEEKLAHIAQTGERPTILQRLITVVRRWLRQYAPGLKYTDSEIRDIVATMNRPLDDGEPTVTGHMVPAGLRYSRKGRTDDKTFSDRIRDAGENAKAFLIDKTPEPVKDFLARAANSETASKLKAIKRGAVEIAAPLGNATPEAAALAKNYANLKAENLARLNDEADWLRKEFTPEQRQRMWDATSAENVARVTGQPAQGGFDTLSPKEREAAEYLQAENAELVPGLLADGILKHAYEIYDPRFLAGIAKEMKGNSVLNKMGHDLRMGTKHALEREHITAEETERAIKEMYGEEAHLIKDILILPFAMHQLRNIKADKGLIESVRQYGRENGAELVVANDKMTEPLYKGYKTIDAPAFREWVPRFIEQDGKTVPMRDQNGRIVMQAQQLYFHPDMESPFKAVLHANGPNELTKAFVALKSKSMGIIVGIFPPVHRSVIFFKTVFTYPSAMLTGRLQALGEELRTFDTGLNPVKRTLVRMGKTGKVRQGLEDSESLKEEKYQAIRDGLRDVSFRQWVGSLEDIEHAPTIDEKVGKSWTAQMLGFGAKLTGKAVGHGDEWSYAVRKAVDDLGHLWHSRWMWEKVANTQYGLYRMVKHDLVHRGMSPEGAGKVAAQIANRFAGAIPREDMGQGMRTFLNLTFFSRSFTFSNLGIYKDAMGTGLPNAIRGQLNNADLKIGKNAYRRVAATVLVKDIIAFLAINSALQSAFAYFTHRKTGDEILDGYKERLERWWAAGHYNPFVLATSINDLTANSQNEPGKTEYIYLGRDSKGTAIYLKNPFGKIGMDLLDTARSPLQLLHRKESTLIKPALEIYNNDEGYGRQVYDPNADGISGASENLLRVIDHLVQAQGPSNLLGGAADLITGKDRSTVNWAKTLGAPEGLFFSKGAPGGPAVGTMYAAQKEHDFQKQQVMPDARKAILSGDNAKAIELMRSAHMTPGEMMSTFKSTLAPESALTKQRIMKFMMVATPDERRAFQEELKDQ